MEFEIETVTAEIKELISQYREEVPGKRKQWPQTIKNQVDQLRHSGMSAKEISTLTGLPYYTVYNWGQQDLASKRKQAGSFIPIQVQSLKKPDSSADEQCEKRRTSHSSWVCSLEI